MTQNFPPQGDPQQPYQPPAQGYNPPGQPYQPAGAPQPGVPMNPYQGQPPTPYPGAGMPAAQGQLADWGTRALGGLVDYVAPSILFNLMGAPFAPQANGTGGGFLYYLFTSILPLAWVIYNSGIKQGTSGQTFGKQIAKTKLVSEATGQPIGIGAAIVRQIAHFVDAIICFVGYLFPLWDAKKQTIADKIMKTVVVKV